MLNFAWWRLEEKWVGEIFLRYGDPVTKPVTPLLILYRGRSSHTILFDKPVLLYAENKPYRKYFNTRYLRP